MRRRLFVVAAVLLGVVSPASASQLVDRNATGVRLATNGKGEALLTYQAAGKLKHVLVWGAVNALQPNKSGRQVKFSLDYSGGYGKYRKVYWKTFGSSCGRYDGPALANVVAACKAPDGSYWAAQEWPEPLPDLGYSPWTATLAAQWLEVSHWTGPVAAFETGETWVYDGRFQELFGRVTYAGQPIYGFGTTNVGAPTDSFGRLIFLDTYNSVYGGGWRRENSFVPHNPTGVFCYGFYSFDPTKGGYQHPAGQTSPRGPGTGSQYRLTLAGPGVTPNVSVTVPGSHPFSPNSLDDQSARVAGDTKLRSWNDRSCMAGLAPATTP
jgi:hypothetical protein